jgi:microcystin-dependent protein
VSTALSTIISDFTTSLAASVSSGATSATLQSATDDDGNALPDGLYYFAIDGDNSQKEYVKCSLAGTALTAISNISRQGGENTGFARAHRVGASVTLTDFAQLKLLTDLLTGNTDLDSAVPLKYDGTALISDDAQLATKKYADDLALSGAPNASVTVKGIVEEATQAEIDADTAAGGTAARLAVNPSTLATSKYGTRLPTANEKSALAGTGTPSSTNKYVTRDTISGALVAWPTNTAPTGWLLCDGSAVSRTTYADLFTIVSTTYGSGDGSTTFNVPNLKGRIPVGRDAAQAEFDTLAETGGAKTHTLLISEMPAHAHKSLGAPGTAGNNPTLNGVNSGTTSAAAGESIGGDGAHNNLQPYIVLNWIIKT